MRHAEDDQEPAKRGHDLAEPEAGTAAYMRRNGDRGQCKHQVGYHDTDRGTHDLSRHVYGKPDATESREQRVGAADDGIETAPDTEPTAKMMATSAAPVATAFSSSSRSVSAGLRLCAAIPDPMTAINRSAVPTNSARARRTSSDDGHSFGAGLALAYALEHPTRTIAVVFESCVLALPGRSDPYEQYRKNRFARLSPEQRGRFEQLRYLRDATTGAELETIQHEYRALAGATDSGGPRWVPSSCWICLASWSDRKPRSKPGAGRGLRNVFSTAQRIERIRQTPDANRGGPR